MEAEGTAKEKVNEGEENNSDIRREDEKERKMSLKRSYKNGKKIMN